MPDWSPVLLAYEDDFLAAAPVGETERVHRLTYHAFRFSAVQLDDHRLRAVEPAKRAPAEDFDLGAFDVELD